MHLGTVQSGQQAPECSEGHLLAVAKRTSAKGDIQDVESEIMKDWCNTDGARRLKDKIAEYWADRGYEVEVDLVDAGFVPAMRSARTDVRSNMVNGMPRRKLVNVNEVRSEYRPD